MGYADTEQCTQYLTNAKALGYTVHGSIYVLPGYNKERLHMDPAK